jgi:N-acetylglucosaminyl-diphospho-decaprenol L-rhamnosyltransferase
VDSPIRSWSYLPALTGGACRVSIVVVSWNTRALLRGCLRSALEAAKEVRGEVEVIVVDNASSDGSRELVEAEFPGVRLIANRTNAGFALATNQGIRESRGEYVLLLNPDTEARPDFLKTLVEVLDTDPIAAAVGPRLVGSDGADQVSCFPLPTLSRELWRLSHLDRLFPMARYPRRLLAATDPQEVESIQGACLLVRRSALAYVGLLDERFFIYTEEIDLCRRLLERGWRIVWVPRAVVVHHGAASTAQVGSRMFIELYRSKVQYFRKHGGTAGAAAYKGVLLLASLARLLAPPLAMAVMPSRRSQCRQVLRNYSSLLLSLRAL